MAVDDSPGAGRVLIATSGGPLVAEPSWTRFDNISACKCYGFDWSRGRQAAFEVTNTGTARVYFNDRNGTFDGNALISAQIMLQLFDPVANAWEPVFRGHIDDIHNTPHPFAPELTNVQVDCVDILDYLAGVKFVVGEMGDVLPSGMSGGVFYEDGPADGRLDDLADDAGLDPDMYVHFSMNIDVHEGLMDTDDSVLGAMRDVCDAEFPLGLANLYCDRFGREVAHGRFAKIDPDGTSSGANWQFTRWGAATRGDVTTGRARIEEFAMNSPRANIVNSFVAWPEQNQAGTAEFDQALIPTLTKTDPTSIAAHGYRGRDAPALIIKEHKTNGNSGADECELFGEFYVTNFADPRDFVETIRFQTVRPGHVRAADIWAIVSRMDISDIIHLWVAEEGLSDTPFFIEGIQGQCRVGPAGWDNVTVTPNLSPADLYETDIFD